MKPVINESRRRLLKDLAFAAAAIPSLQAALAAEAPLVTPDDPTAKALKYVPDASKAADAKPGSSCANCVNYQGAAGSAQGGCVLFPGKSVKATGWCASWTKKG